MEARTDLPPALGASQSHCCVTNHSQPLSSPNQAFHKGESHLTPRTSGQEHPGTSSPPGMRTRSCCSSQTRGAQSLTVGTSPKYLHWGTQKEFTQSLVRKNKQITHCAHVSWPMEAPASLQPVIPTRCSPGSLGSTWHGLRLPSVPLRAN